jgi:hypothetical protein
VESADVKCFAFRRCAAQRWPHPAGSATSTACTAGTKIIGASGAARPSAGTSVVQTFDPHRVRLDSPPLLMTMEKLAALERAGVRA